MIRPKRAPFTDIDLVRRAGVVRYNPRETPVEQILILVSRHGFMRRGR
jgi:hypothetical protein